MVGKDGTESVDVGQVVCYYMEGEIDYLRLCLVFLQEKSSSHKD